MTFAGRCRSVINGWRMHRAMARSLRSLRSVDGALWLPVHQMSDDELDASVVVFSWVARMYGTPAEDVTASLGTVRKAFGHASQRQSDPNARQGQNEWPAVSDDLAE